VVEKERARVNEFEAQVAQLGEQLKRLGAAMATGGKTGAMP
jgi:predicted Rossmann-fold nucleotide-binding protein